MKILMLNSEYPPLGGGQGSANYFIYQTLQNYPNLQTDLVTASTHNSYTQESKIGTIYYLDIDKQNKDIHTQSIKNLILYSIKSLWKSFKLIRRTKYDVVVAWSGLPAGFLAMTLKILFGKPYIVLLRGADVPFHEKKWEKLDKWIFSWLSPIVWKYASFVIANSDKLCQTALRSSPKQSIQVIYNGIDTKKFFPIKKSNSKTLKLITVGRLSLIKGQRYLIEALKNLPNTELFIIGEGDLKIDLQQLAQQINVTVHLLGQVPNNEIPKYLQEADIFALPSLNEGMSNALLEAMACGLPVIVTDVGGTKELLQNNGILVEKESSESIREAIQTYRNQPELLKIHGANSRKITEEMSWEAKTQEFFQAFQKAIKN